MHRKSVLQFYNGKEESKQRKQEHGHNTHLSMCHECHMHQVLLQSHDRIHCLAAKQQISYPDESKQSQTKILIKKYKF